jgi:hypothetical protein
MPVGDSVNLWCHLLGNGLPFNFSSSWWRVHHVLILNFSYREEEKWRTVGREQLMNQWANEPECLWAESHVLECYAVKKNLKNAEAFMQKWPHYIRQHDKTPLLVVKGSFNLEFLQNDWFQIKFLTVSREFCL